MRHSRVGLDSQLRERLELGETYARCRRSNRGDREKNGRRLDGRPQIEGGGGAVVVQAGNCCDAAVAELDGSSLNPVSCVGTIVAARLRVSKLEENRI